MKFKKVLGLTLSAALAVSAVTPWTGMTVFAGNGNDPDNYVLKIHDVPDSITGSVTVTLQDEDYYSEVNGSIIDLESTTAWDDYENFEVVIADEDSSITATLTTNGNGNDNDNPNGVDNYWLTDIVENDPEGGEEADSIQEIRIHVSDELEEQLENKWYNQVSEFRMWYTNPRWGMDWYPCVYDLSGDYYWTRDVADTMTVDNYEDEIEKFRPYITWVGNGPVYTLSSPEVDHVEITKDHHTASPAERNKTILNIYLDAASSETPIETKTITIKHIDENQNPFSDIEDDKVEVAADTDMEEWVNENLEGYIKDIEGYEYDFAITRGDVITIKYKLTTVNPPEDERLANVTFTVDPAYGYFTEYGEGPVKFENIPEDSTEQFEVPAVTAKAGYKFVGWKGQGADVIEWDAGAKTFGVPGLCYFDGDSKYGYASIEAVFEEVPADQRYANVYFTVNSEYGSFTEYGEGPVTFLNIPEDSTQQFEVPAVTAKAGYKFVGWKGQGADVIEWDADAKTFGVPGLCYFDGDAKDGYASIEAVFEKIPAKQRYANVYFTVNPEYGSFTEYGEGPVTFLNIPEDSTQQFEVPKVTAKAGYKFVGWKGQGADVIKWDADATTFGVPGLCYFDGDATDGYASIEAVFEEVPADQRYANVYFTVNSEYGYFTEYGEGPVTFLNIPEDSTQQFEVPKVTAKPGYKFVGWKGQGADVIEWDAAAYSFGVPGLCYFDGDAKDGYASIEAVFEEVPADQRYANVYFTVNSEYGYFTEYGEGPVTFLNIPEDSTQQFEVPAVTAKAGYKFVGWKGQGADVIEWDAAAYSFGVPGLCYFQEGETNGYASIEAVFEKIDEVDPTDPTDPTDPDDGGNLPYIPSNPDTDIEDPDVPLTPDPGEDIDDNETPLAPNPDVPEAIPGSPADGNPAGGENIEDDDVAKTDAPPQTGRKVAGSLALLASAAVVAAVTLKKRED